MLEIILKEIQKEKNQRVEKASLLSEKKSLGFGAALKYAKRKNQTWVVPQCDGKKKLWRETEPAETEQNP